MSAKRIFVKKDTTIYSESITANTGASPILEVFSTYNGVTKTPTSKKEWARILLNFNLSSVTSAIINAKTIPNPTLDSNVSAYLYMQNVPHGEAMPSSFTLNVFPLTKEWDEGNGLDQDTLSHTGFSNAVSAQSSVDWTLSGGDFSIDSNSAIQSFDHGEENLKINITNIFNNWLDGTSANFGIVVKLDETQESATGSLSATYYHRKKFYSRQTNTTKQPYIQLEWDGAIKDHRDFIPYNSSGNLFFYNIVNGQFEDLNSTGNFNGFVTLSGLSGASYSAITTGLSAERHAKGIYKCNIPSFALTSNVYSAFTDQWYISASPTATYAFTFTPLNASNGLDNYVSASYKVAFKNLKNYYEKNTKARIRMHIKDSSFAFTSATATSSANTNFTCTDGYFEVRERTTDLVEIPLSPLSFDKNGNFFDLDCSNLYLGVQYKVCLKLNMRGEILWFDYPDLWDFEII